MPNRTNRGCMLVLATVLIALAVLPAAYAVCEDMYEKRCYNNDVYWYDSCGSRGYVFEPCGSTRTCTNAQCVDISCTNDCTTTGTKECFGADYYKTCGQYDGDSCLEWSSATYCPYGQYCTGGNCVPSCTPSCSGKQCGSDGCSGTCGTCSSGQTCTNGQCVSSCTPATCSSLGKNCGSQSDGCGGTLSCGSCQTGQSCSNGQCISARTAVTFGSSKYESGFYATSTTVGDTLEYSTTVPSGTTKVRFSLTASSCMDVSMSSPCTIGAAGYYTPTTCEATVTPGTLNFDIDTYFSYCSSTSPGAFTVKVEAAPSCSNDCSSSGAKECSGSGYRTCGNYDSDSCLEWSSVVSCSSSQTCSGGTCVSVPSAKSNGESCSSNSGCLSGNCQNGLCCTSGKTCCSYNSQCSSTQECSTYYYCIPKTVVVKKSNGQSCSYSSDCESGNCYNDVCCAYGKTCCGYDSNCGTGYECGSSYYCIQSTTTLKSNYQSCSSNGECSSGNCNTRNGWNAVGLCCPYGITCCNSVNDCASGKTCENTVCISIPITETTETCESHGSDYKCMEDCTGASCDTSYYNGDPAYTCSSGLLCCYGSACEETSLTAETVVKKTHGESCSIHSDCETNHCGEGSVCCQDGKICCKEHSDCPTVTPALYCGYQHFCELKKDNGGLCNMDAECKSAFCMGGSVCADREAPKKGLGDDCDISSDCDAGLACKYRRSETNRLFCCPQGNAYCCSQDSDCTKSGDSQEWYCYKGTDPDESKRFSCQPVVRSYAKYTATNIAETAIVSLNKIGVACSSDDQCATRHCSNGACCGDGVCCRSIDDCSSGEFCSSAIGQCLKASTFGSGETASKIYEKRGDAIESFRPSDTPDLVTDFYIFTASKEGRAVVGNSATASLVAVNKGYDAYYVKAKIDKLSGVDEVNYVISNSEPESEDKGLLASLSPIRWVSKALSELDRWSWQTMQVLWAADEKGFLKVPGGTMVAVIYSFDPKTAGELKLDATVEYYKRGDADEFFLYDESTDTYTMITQGASTDVAKKEFSKTLTVVDDKKCDIIGLVCW